MPKKPAPDPEDEDAVKAAESLSNVWLPVFVSLINLWGVLVSKIGRLGTVLLFLYGCISGFANEQQQNQFFQTFFLGEGVTRLWPYAVMIVCCLVIVMGQKWRYEKTLLEKNREIDRLTVERNGLQTQLSRTPFTHVRSK